ncbi:MAG: hypothetical protein F4227_01095 [Gammaproteobacteria bacterium]|nr:hypothetical protein [Gammaproteobacteria bacterium]MYI76302.1 hypothetical protein [Gammaproteobacteria bacterium]
MRVEDLHSSDWAGVCYLTGGGSLLLSQLLSVPGASTTILDAQVPYSYEALVLLLGSKPEQACSETAARNLAMKAFMTAQHLRSTDQLFGLGITASLSTNRKKRGAIRAFVALQTMSRSQVTELKFADSRTREDQESMLADVAYSKLCAGLELASDAYPNYQTHTAIAHASHSRLYKREPVALGTRTKVYFPGAFNPLHTGHRRMHALAQELLQREVQYELSVNNVDKLPLDYFDLNERLNQFAPDEVVLTNLPYFFNKAKYLSKNGGVSFVVGIDTFARIIQPKYYNTGEQLDDVINFFIASGTKFLVFGRTVQNKFKTIKDLSMPDGLRQLCQQVDAPQFQCDVSSSTLRSET